MKKRLTPFTVFSLLGGILFSSCTNFSGLSIAKRHYRSGYYVSSRKSPCTIAAAATNKVKIDKKATETSLPKQEITAVVDEPSIVTSQNTQVYQKKSDSKKTKESHPVIAASGYAKQSAITFHAEAKSSAANQSEGHEVVIVTPGVPYVVIILCAIFIPPLGVGLMYGINSYFWIDLILTLLFFFPGMIFALIVVLM